MNGDINKKNSEKSTLTIIAKCQYVLLFYRKKLFVLIINWYCSLKYDEKHFLTSQRSWSDKFSGRHRAGSSLIK